MHDLQTAAILEHVAKGATLSEAARLAGVPVSTVYRRRRTDDDFKAALDDAMEESVDVLESTARYRAVHGVAEPVIYQGQLTPVWARGEDGQPILNEHGNPVQAVDEAGQPVWLTVRKPSDALLMMLLKGRRKEVFSERKELTGANGAALPAAVQIVTGVPAEEDPLAGIA